jgi:hypothetical protein
VTAWARQASALLLLLAGALAAGACQPPPPVAAPAPPPPAPELTLCERPARPAAAVGNAEVEASFRSFALAWLEKRRKGSSAGRHFEIREEFEIELRATGSAAAPYVGTLRYCEHELPCPAAFPPRCTASRRSVITEIFRLESGEWQY